MAQQGPETEREYSRAPANIAVRFEAGSFAGAGTIRNISLAGVFVETSDLAALGQTVDLQFPLPTGGSTISIQGVVVRVEDEFGFNDRIGMGIQFARPSRSALGAVEAYVRRMRRLLRVLKLELAEYPVNGDRVARLVTDTGLDLPGDPRMLKALVPEMLLQFRLRGRSKLRKPNADP